MSPPSQKPAFASFPPSARSLSQPFGRPCSLSLGAGSLSEPPAVPLPLEKETQTHTLMQNQASADERSEVDEVVLDISKENRPPTFSEEGFSGIRKSNMSTSLSDLTSTL